MKGSANMIYEYTSLFLGIIKLIIYKLFNFSKIKICNLSKINVSFKIAMKNNAKLIVDNGFRGRNNISFRIYNGTVSIGEKCFFNDGCSINCRKNITIGDNCLFGQDTKIFDHDHDYKNDINQFIEKEVNIGNNVWLGANVIILKGVNIGDNVIIAAGTIVKNDIPSNSLVYDERTTITKVINYEK